MSNKSLAVYGSKPPTKVITQKNENATHTKPKKKHKGPSIILWLLLYFVMQAMAIVSPIFSVAIVTFFVMLKATHDRNKYFAQKKKEAEEKKAKEAAVKKVRVISLSDPSAPPKTYIIADGKAYFN